ncbi:hypothetical protein [Pedobacter aquatilis]|uniref:hypothetical protein n=1 Tax=Pedobacter aquatilis TaxID=351343 RepID=UPI00292EA508|nr:hypothetical protein [Pedobacter aquatilis]
MRKNFKMQLALPLVILLSLAACKKNNVTEDTSTSTTPTTTITNPTTNPVSTAPSYDVGTGSGYLTIDGNSLDLTSIKLIKIKAGSYKGIYIKNISGTAANPIYIKNSGQVIITEGMETTNVNYLNFLGDNESTITYGFSFENIAFRALKFRGKMSNVTIKNVSFKNVTDYVMAGEADNGLVAYDGTSSTRIENFKILNCLFDNTGSISFGGNLNKETGEDTGLYKDIEIAYNIFQNSPNVGTVCSFTNVQDYNIHHNVVNDINQSTNNHNGVFFMQGNGKFHDNKLTNYQGNSIRVWGYSRGSTPAMVEIYNNICYNTRKYGAFEIQEFARNIVPGKSTFINAKVYNNTVGKMNTSKDWEGQILDLYNFGGTLEFNNNLGFDLNRVGKETTDMINYNGNSTSTTITNNKYYATQALAVLNITTFVSLISGIGAPAQ